MRTLQWLGKLLLLAVLAAFVVPGVAEADRRHRHRDRDWRRSRVVVYDSGWRHDHGYHRGHHHHRGCDHGHWRRERIYYPAHRGHYPRHRRGSVGVVIHIPF